MIWKTAYHMEYINTNPISNWIYTGDIIDTNYTYRFKEAFYVSHIFYELIAIHIYVTKQLLKSTLNICYIFYYNTNLMS